MGPMNLLKKLIFLREKPKIIIVVGEGRASAAEAIYQILKEHFKTKKIIEDESLPFLRRDEILIFQTKLPFIFSFKKLEFLVKRSTLPILVVTHLGDIPPHLNFFAASRERSEEILKLAKTMPPFGRLILNFDDETVREINDFTNLHTLTFGFGKDAHFYASDIKINTTTHLKLNHKGNLIPVRLPHLFGKEQIYSVLSAFCLGKLLNLNLIEIAEDLANYKSLPGRMRLIQGIKGSLILDDSESASIFSMLEALEILDKINREELIGEFYPFLKKEPKLEGRKIAVLGDVIGVGKYSIEAHERVGEKIPKVADLLFTVGGKAKFIAQAAEIQGMEKEKIFSFYEKKELIPFLKERIRRGDLILVDGSKEMEMGEIVEVVKL